MSGLRYPGGPRPSRRPTIPARLAPGLVDQGLSSLTNFVPVMVAANKLTTEDLGAFALALSTYALPLGLYRATVGQPQLISNQHQRGSQFHTAALAVALFGTVAVALAMGLAGGSLKTHLGALALLMPGLIAHDHVRHFYMQQNRWSQAIILDGAWLGMCLAAVLFAPIETATHTILAWGLPGSIVGIGAVVRLRPRIGHRQDLKAYLREEGNLAFGLTLEQVAQIVTGPAVAVLVAFTLSVESVGHLRVAQTLFGPITVVQAGLVPIYLTMLRHGGDTRTITRRNLPVLLGTTAFGILLLLIPPQVGTFILGESWEGAAVLLLPFALVRIGISIEVVWVAQLRAWRRMSSTYIIRMTSALATVLAAGLVPAKLGLVAFAWSLVAIRFASTASWARAYSVARLDASPETVGIP